LLNAAGKPLDGKALLMGLMSQGIGGTRRDFSFFLDLTHYRHGTPLMISRITA
jgi:hypothetical protein